MCNSTTSSAWKSIQTNRAFVTACAIIFTPEVTPADDTSVNSIENHNSAPILQRNEQEKKTNIIYNYLR